MKLINELKKRVLVLDGAMGTTIQNYNLNEKNCCELLNISHPKIIEEIHKNYIEAGADIIETNTINGNSLNLKNYGLKNKVYDICYAGTKIAKKIASEYEKREIFVAGSIGPTNKSLTLLSKQNPDNKNIYLSQMRELYFEQIRGIIDGGADILLIETIFDILNAQIAVEVCETLMQEKKVNLPIMLSATIDHEGKIFSGESIEDFIKKLDRKSIISYGFNCSFGAKEITPFIEKLSTLTPKIISCYPNAGLPNKLGKYEEVPEIFTEYLKTLIENQNVNILGGCCGTTYQHIKKISQLVKNQLPRKFKIDFE